MKLELTIEEIENLIDAIEYRMHYTGYSVLEKELYEKLKEIIKESR